MQRARNIGSFQSDRSLLVLCMLFLWSTKLIAQCPSTVISANDTTYCISEYIELEASNVPMGSSLRWNLGAGFVGGNSIFKGTATSPGVLSVDLELTLANGTVCNYSNNNATNVLPLPTPQFSVSRNLLCEGVDTVLLKDETANSQFRSWVINGATLAITPKEAIFNINKATTQHITLIVEDSSGCSNSLTKNNAIRVYKDLDLDFTLSNADHCLPFSTNLTSSFTLGNQKVNSYTWSLPGSNNTSIASKDVSNVSYPNAGAYSVEFTIQTSQGCTYTLEKKNLVRLGETATLGISVPKSQLCLSEKTVVTQTTNPLPGSFKWITPSFSSQKVSKYDLRLNYRDTGTYDITVEYNHNGCISSKTENSAIHVSGMKADFKSDNALHCETPHTVSLVNHSDTTSGTVSSYKWEIIDESNGSTILSSNQKEYSPTITASPISYSVKLITTSSLGCSDTALKKKFIQISPYQFNFYAEPIIGCIDQEIKYTNKTPSASYYGLDLFSWDFYDKDSITLLGSSASLSPTFTYTDTGHYYTKLTAANPLGCQETFTQKSVWITKPNLQFTLEDTVMCLSDSVLARGSSTPISPLLRHSYTLIHQNTGKVYQFYGDSVYLDVPEVGAYDVKYTYGAQDECIDTISKTLWVNGVKGSISLDSSSGCAPFIVQPSLDLEYNYHVGNPDTTLKYNWVSSPKNGTALEGSSNERPVVNILNNGNFSVQTFIINSTGCGQYINSSRISTGIKANFTIDKIKACIDDTINLKSTTQNGPSSLNWSILNAKTGTWDSVSFEDRKLVVQDTGFYEIALFVNKDDVCFDTLTKLIEVRSIEAYFNAVDSLIGCAPATLQLENLATNADEIIWYFGDGDSLITPSVDTVSHLYKQNSLGGGFSVIQVVSNAFGCLDTFIKPNFVNLVGPVANIEVTNSRGCEPRIVSFTNTSKFYTDYYIDYGDSSKIDTNTLGTHTYLNKLDQTTQFFSPKIIVVDAGGCIAEKTLYNEIRVHNYPVILPTFAPDTIVCQRESIVISDTGLYSNRYSWSINDSTFSTQKKDTVEILNSGINTLTLISKNDHGCADTFTQYIYTKPSAVFDFDVPPFICQNQPTTISLDVTSNGAVQSYHWDFGEPQNADNIQNTVASTATISYLTPGKKKVVVTPISNNGCDIQDSITIMVFDPAKIPVVQLRYAGYDSLNKIILDYPAFNFSYFDKFNIYRNNALLRLDTLNKARILIDSTSTFDQQNCYNLSITEKCGVEGARGRAHCPVQMTVSGTDDRKIHLEWTYYVGWNRVDRYEIYRREVDSAFKKVGEVFNTQKSYTDSSNVCDVLYYYKVAAVQSQTELISFSNTEIAQTTINLNEEPAHIDNVSILSENAIELRWQPSTFRYNDHYQLTRYSGSLNNLDATLTTDTTYFIDSFPLQDNPYVYLLKEVDNCGELSQSGNIGKTIYLQGSSSLDSSNIFWTPYEKWDYPIVEHHVEYMSPQGPVYLAKLPENQYSFIDNGFYEDQDGYYKYRVYSVNSNADTSYSNTAYVSGNGVYEIPNAFTPNGDGTNDVFNYYTHFIISGESNFEIQIFNRWGSLVYKSNDISTNWDGKYNGDYVPNGIYLYNIKFTDGTQKTNHVTGTVHVLR